MKRIRWCSTVGCALALGLASAFPVGAAIVPQEKMFEVILQEYVPGPSELDSGLSYGISFGYNWTERISFGAEIGYVSLSGDSVENATTVEVDYTSWSFDFVTDFNFAAKSRCVPVIFVGIGWATESVDAKSSSPLVIVEVENAYDRGFTLQAGGALKIEMGKRFELRPGVRWRWFNERPDDAVDTEYLVGFGYRF